MALFLISLSEVLFRKKSKPPLWNSKVTKINLDVGAHFDRSRIWEQATLEHAQFLTKFLSKFFIQLLAIYH